MMGSPSSGGVGEALYNGVSYAEIVQRLEDQLGGRPERGARTSFIFTMACNLRYICNDDAAWVASILPPMARSRKSIAKPSKAPSTAP